MLYMHGIEPVAL